MLSAANTDLDSMVFITGFARGGTSWLRDCIGTHPDVSVLKTERTVFRDLDDYNAIPALLEPEIRELLANKKLVVNKAPANAPYLYKAAKRFPSARFLFIIRDPRDVLTSHQRGNKAWMKGKNSEVEGSIEKIKNYYDGYKAASDLDNVMLVRYEDLHQNFPKTMGRIFDFIRLDYNDALILEIFEKVNFQAQTNRAHKEDRDSAKRKGVISDWSLNLSDSEKTQFKESAFIQRFFEQNNYFFDEITYKNIVDSMFAAGAHFLNEQDLLDCSLKKEKLNIVLQHDIDYLNKNFCFESVLNTARIEKHYGISAQYNFLPLDDSRYSDKDASATLDLMREIVNINENAFIGLHVNACEKFYPHSAPNDPSGKYLDQIVSYVHTQVNDYRLRGVEFKIATSHGYARGKKIPNNRDTPEIESALGEHNIRLFDTVIRPELKKIAAKSCAITDVGGILKPRKLGCSQSLIDVKTYEALPENTFLRFLTHPGNYDVLKPSVVAMRNF